MLEVFLLDVRLRVALKSFQVYLCKQNLQTVYFMPPAKTDNLKF